MPSPSALAQVLVVFPYREHHMIHRARVRHGHQTAAVTSETYDEDIVVLRVFGEVTIESADRIDLDVRRVCRSGPTILLVDLTGVTFFGAAGLTLLLDVHRRTQLAGTALSLVAPPRVARLLVITGLAQVLRVRDTLRHALAAMSECPVDAAEQAPTEVPRTSDVDTRRRSLRLVPD